MASIKPCSSATNPPSDSTSSSQGSDPQSSIGGANVLSPENEKERSDSFRSPELSHSSIAKQEIILIIPLSIYNGFVRYGIRGACLASLAGACGWGFLRLLMLLRNRREQTSERRTKNNASLKDEETGESQQEGKVLDYGEESIKRMFISLVFVDRMIVLCLDDTEIDIFEILGKLIEGVVLYWVSRLALPKLTGFLAGLERRVRGVMN
jgi:hypothetical protein